MKAKELLSIGFKPGPVIGLVLKAAAAAKEAGISSVNRRSTVRELFSNPQSCRDNVYFGEAAKLWDNVLHPEETYKFSSEGKLLTIWGEENIEEQAIEQMKRAMEISPAVQGAIMADAHYGYGIPIGGVLALDNVVSPFSVGVDIACRMMLTVTTVNAEQREQNFIDRHAETITNAIHKHTRFGLGAAFQGKDRRDHRILDRDWSIITNIVDKDIAWNQLGSSGGGNHFLDIGEIEFIKEFRGVLPGKYVAIMTHSGSRGLGSKIATYYTRLAQSKHPLLPAQYRRLAWLSLDEAEGMEYWAAMEFAGEYASANHHLIHQTLLKELGLETQLQVENHHNFAWKEEHNGRTLIVHRKGATPAETGVLGVIPGSMASPAFLVSGKGNPNSLNSAAHGAGRRMSRTKAKETYRWPSVKDQLRHRKVKLISAGIDEVPGAYKDIQQVMDAQSDLVKIIAKFNPRLVKMAGDGYVED